MNILRGRFWLEVGWYRGEVVRILVRRQEMTDLRKEMDTQLKKTMYMATDLFAAFLLQSIVADIPRARLLGCLLTFEMVKVAQEANFMAQTIDWRKW